jgi:putative aldouronate transport system permease protein
MKQSKASKTFDFFNLFLLSIISLITLYPFWDVIVSSVISLEEYVTTNFHLWPRKLNLDSYKFIFGMDELWNSYGVTLFITIVGTIINMVLTTLTAYVLSKNLKGSRVIMFLIVFTMLFSGGMIPLYIVVRKVGIMNTPWALIFPTAIQTWNLILMKNFFYTIPESLEESAKLDGANDMTILMHIVLPLSLPVLATISLFYAVYHWNEYFHAVMFITTKKNWPLQLFLRAMLFENEASTQSGGDDPSLLGMPIKMAAIAVAVIPIMAAYPFFQKYFVKGVLIGAVKG